VRPAGRPVVLPRRPLRPFFVGWTATHGTWRISPSRRSPARCGASWTDTGVRREQRRLKHRQGRDALSSEPARADNASDGSSRHVRHDGRWPALPRSSPGPTHREHVRPGLAKGTGQGTDGGRGRQSTRRTSVRPAACGGVDVAGRGCPADAGRRVGRPQRRRAAPGLRQVPRRPGGRGPPPDRRRTERGLNFGTLGTDGRCTRVSAGYARTTQDRPLTV
jgi:hypothetical protein